MIGDTSRVVKRADVAERAGKYFFLTTGPLKKAGRNLSALIFHFFFGGGGGGGGVYFLS